MRDRRKMRTRKKAEVGQLKSCPPFKSLRVKTVKRLSCLLCPFQIIDFYRKKSAPGPPSLARLCGSPAGSDDYYLPSAPLRVFKSVCPLPGAAYQHSCPDKSLLIFRMICMAAGPFTAYPPGGWFRTAPQPHKNPTHLKSREQQQPLKTKHLPVKNGQKPSCPVN